MSLQKKILKQLFCTPLTNIKLTCNIQVRIIGIQKLYHFQKRLNRRERYRWRIEPMVKTCNTNGFKLSLVADINQSIKFVMPIYTFVSPTGQFWTWSREETVRFKSSTVMCKNTNRPFPLDIHFLWSSLQLEPWICTSHSNATINIL